jgi:glycosyltransferase involved in cell wall biosynthesis
VIRILYLNNAPFVGGAQITLRNIIRRLDKTRFAAILVIPQGSSRDVLEFFGQSGAEIVPVQMPAISIGSPRSVARALETVCKLHVVVRSRQIDIIHSNTPRGGVYGVVLRPFTRARFVWTINDVGLFPHIKLLTIFADQVTCVSRVVQSRLPSRAEARLIYNGVEEDEALVARRTETRNELRASLGIPQNALVVGNVTRIEPWKGVHISALAVAQVCRARGDVWFVQVGPVAPGCDAYAREVRRMFDGELVERAVFMGFQSDVQRWFSVFDVFVHTPTISKLHHTEAFGMNVAEAMGYGLPVVASNVGSLPEVVDAGTTGVLVPNGSVEHTAAELLALLDDEGQRWAFGQAGRLRQQRLFAQQREVSEFESLYMELVHAGPLTRSNMASCVADKPRWLRL